MSDDPTDRVAEAQAVVDRAARKYAEAEREYALARLRLRQVSPLPAGHDRPYAAPRPDPLPAPGGIVGKIMAAFVDRLSRDIAPR